MEYTYNCIWWKIKDFSADFDSQIYCDLKKLFHGNANWSCWRKITISKEHILLKKV